VIEERKMAKKAKSGPERVAHVPYKGSSQVLQLE